MVSNKSCWKKEDAQLWLSSQVTVIHNGALSSWKRINIWLPKGSKNKLPFLLSFDAQLLLYVLNNFYLKP